MMKISGLLLIGFFGLLGCATQGDETPWSAPIPLEEYVLTEHWLSNPARTILFERQSPQHGDIHTTDGESTIVVTPGRRFQEIDGFGYTLTGGSAMHLNRMSEPQRAAILQELFGTGAADIGVSYLRLSIGASDLDPEAFSYSDLPAGEKDPELLGFSLDRDRTDLIPVLKEILAINPDIKLMGSPWSPPVWMKTNGRSIGGSLKPEYYEAYARYLVKYVEGMRDEGIRIDAITVQNEPLHPGNNPSLSMASFEQAAFIRNNLGPAFEAAGLDTRIIIYDHNADRIDYPLDILKDEAAARYVDGSAFHLYGGEISALSQVHEAFPDKNLYFTEQWVGAPGNMTGDLLWHVENLIIGATRNWCRTVLEWNLAADPDLEPHTPGGCTECLGAITIDGDQITRNPAYYIIAHASKAVRPGSVRIDSIALPGLPNVAFLTPDQKIVLVTANASASPREALVELGGQTTGIVLPGKSVATYVWSAPAP